MHLSGFADASHGGTRSAIPPLQQAATHAAPATSPAGLTELGDGLEETGQRMMRHLVMCSLGFAAALSLGTAATSAAQDTTRARPQTHIRVRKDEPQTPAPRVDTVTVTRSDTVVLRRTDTLTVTRTDTVTR